MKPTVVTDLRRIAIIFIIVSLSLTALVGIVTLLTASFGEVQGKIILTTLLVAGFSITSRWRAALCASSAMSESPCRPRPSSPARSSSGAAG